MPDITAARPASGEPIGSAWGAEVHDAIEALSAGGKIKILTGVGIVNLAAAASATVTVPFGVTFAALPVAVACIQGNTALYFGSVSGISTTEIILRATHRDGSSTTTAASVAWIAIGLV